MPAKGSSIPRMIIVLTLTCAVMGGALSVVYDQTRQRIEEQERLYKLKSIEAVLPEHDNQPDKEVAKIPHPERGEVEFYIGKKQGQLTGWAFEWSNPEGYGGEIKVLIGVDTQGTITGIEILPGHAETPGLGAKIQEESWQEQFSGRNMENTKWAVDKDGGDIQAITGATISPRAVTNALKEGLQFLNEHREEIAAGSEER
jgi:electron transport complex protein RnfG